MSTWHQRQAWTRNGMPAITHPTIVLDPPEEMRTHMSFTTERQARTVLADWKARDVPDAKHAWVAVPEGWKDPV